MSFTTLEIWNIHHRLPLKVESHLWCQMPTSRKPNTHKFYLFFVPLLLCQVQIPHEKPIKTIHQFFDAKFLLIWIGMKIWECENVDPEPVKYSNRNFKIFFFFLSFFTALTVRYLTRRFIGEYRSNTDLLYKQTITLDSGLLDVEIIDISADDEEGFPSDQIQWADAVLIVRKFLCICVSLFINNFQKR